MSDVMEHLSSQLDEKRIQEIAKYLGADASQVEQAISVAVPTMLGAMGKAADTQDGAHAIANQMHALGGGSLTDLLGGLLGGGSPSATPRASSPASMPDLSSITGALPKSSGSGDSLLNDALDGVRSSMGQSAPRSAPTQSAPPSARPGLPGGLGDILGNVLGGHQGKVADAVGKSSGLSMDKVGPLLVILGPLVLGALRSKAQASTNSSGKIDPSDLTNILRKERQSIDQKPGGSLLGRFLDQDGDGDFDLSDVLKLGMKFLFKR